jgi:rhodanese-related sulfurtransferase
LIPQLRPAELAAWRVDPARTPPVLVDVREPWEFDLCRIDGSLLLPMGDLGARVAELPRDRPLVMVCHHGNRSYYAAAMLAHAGFPDVHNLQGGVEAWATDVDPEMRRY